MEQENLQRIVQIETILTRPWNFKEVLRSWISLRQKEPLQATKKDKVLDKAE